MPQSYDKLDEFLEINLTDHRHITFDEVQELYRATDNVGAGEIVLRMQKVVLACGICSVILAESSPTYYASAHTVGHRGIGN